MKTASQCRTFVVAGHSGSGKTSLCDLMLFKAGAVPRCGSVDQKNSVSDYMPEEQEKQSSIYSTPLHCDWKDTRFFFIDTPGYAEYAGESVSAMRSANAGLVVLDAVDGPQVGTARAWKFTREFKIPRFGVINRLDRERADFAATLEKMRHNHGKNVVIPLTCPIGSESKFSGVFDVIYGENPPAEIADTVEEARNLWFDAIAETDEEVMERYLDGQSLTKEEIDKGLREVVLSQRVIPVFAASSAKDVGVTEMMDYIVKLFPTPFDRREVVCADGTKELIREDAPPQALVFKMINDPFIGQLSFFRVTNGVFKPDTEVFNISRKSKERLGSLLLLNGKTQETTDMVAVGGIFAVAKLKDTHVGDTIGGKDSVKLLPPIPFPKPVMSYAVTAVKSGEDEKIASSLAKLAECDPTIRLTHDEETHEFLLSGMGDQHLAIVLNRLKSQYKVDAHMETPKVPYRETVTGAGEGHYRHKKQTGGAGQFAEVMLKVGYNEGGYEFTNDVVGGNIPKNFIPAVEKGVLEMLEKGPLVGCKVQNVKVSVYDGKYHPVDSNEMAFKIASRMAFKDAMSKAHPVVLEPIMTVKIHIPDECMGDISGDLNHKRGRILGMNMEEGMEVVTAEVPMAEMAKYATELRSITRGKGSFEMEFARYEQVPANVANEIIAKHQAEEQEED